MTKLATICYIDNGKELLLLHRNKKPNDVHEGKWISVGGKLEAGETPDECARREILEETHFTVTEMDFKGMITFPEFTPGHDWYTYVFKVTGFEGELISDEESREGTLNGYHMMRSYLNQLGKVTTRSSSGFLKIDLSSLQNLSMIITKT